MKLFLQEARGGRVGVGHDDRPATSADEAGLGGVIIRRDYLIGRFRVVFESGGGWRCVCAAFTSSNSCRHSREAAGMKAAQAKIKDGVAPGRSQLSRDGERTAHAR